MNRNFYYGQNGFGFTHYSYGKLPIYRMPDELNIPDSAKLKKTLPIGGEFFVPEFKLSQCGSNRVDLMLPYYRSFKISMNSVKRQFRKAESQVKAAGRKFNEELNKLLGDNGAEIKQVEAAIQEKIAYLYGLDCDYQNNPQSYLCKSPQAKILINELADLQEKLKKLKSKRKYWGSFDEARQKFQSSLKELASSEIKDVSWPKNWPTLDEIENLPIIINQQLGLPRTLKDMNVDTSLIQKIPIPQNIEKMINIPDDLQAEFDFESLKDQIQFENPAVSAQQMLTSLANQAMEELQKYNMCLFIKNSPYQLQINLEYVSDFRKLIEIYIMGCIEKARNAALVVFFGYIPTIINTYGAAITIALSNAFATFWSTFKKCIFDIYNAFKQDIENIANVESFTKFLEAIEKYVSVDIDLEKRTVPWENKGYLIDLVTYRQVRSRRQFPISIDPSEEYVQSDPQFSYPLKNYTLDEESLKKLINKCGRHGMWIFITLKELDSMGYPINFWLNVKGFENNILSGYTVTRTNIGKLKRNTIIPIQNIKNLQCYDPSTDSIDNQADVFVKQYFTDFCSTNQGIFFGKGFLDIGKGVLIYYEIYECGVITRIYIDGIAKSELYIPRFGTKVEHKYTHPLTQTSDLTLLLDMDKKEDELQQRLRIWLFENVLGDMINLTFWKIKLPW